MIPVRRVCPRCGAYQVREKRKSLGDPTLSILQCERCGHLWKPASDAPPPAAARTCAKCGSTRVCFVGRSPSGRSYYRCDQCEQLASEET